MDNERDIKLLRGENYVADYMIKIDAYLIKCVIGIQLGIAVLRLQSQARAAESRILILVGVLFLSPLLSRDWRFKGNGGRGGY